MMKRYHLVKHLRHDRILILIGFTSTGYRVFDPLTKEINEVCNVAIDVNYIGFPPQKNQQLRRTFFSKFNLTPVFCTYLLNSPILNENPTIPHPISDVSSN